MRRALLSGLALVFLLAALAAAGAWLLYTQPGLAWSLGRAQWALPGLSVEAASGTWAHGVSAKRIRFRSADMALDAEHVQIVLSLSSVLRGEPSITTLAAHEVTLTMAESDERTGAPQSLALPLNLDIAMARIARLVVHRAGQRTVFTDIAVSYAGGRREHVLRTLAATHEQGRLQAEGTVSAATPFALTGGARVTVEQPAALTVDAQLGGTLLDLRVTGQVQHAAASARVTALLHPFAETPVARIEATADDIDLRRLDSSMPRTKLAAHIVLAPHGKLWTGPLAITNALSGSWDRERLPVTALRARLTLSGQAAEVDRLQLELGAAGRLDGRATLKQDRAELDLNARALDLRGLHAALRTTRLDGTIAATLERERQAVAAKLVQQDIRLVFDATRAGDDVRVQRFSAQARGGDVRGVAQLSLAGARPYSASATLSAFDPSAWGEFPAGAVSGRVAVEGALQREEVRVRYALDRSRLLGAPLEGSGSFAYAKQRISSAQVKLAWGANTVAADGAFGAPGDTFALRLAARDLALLDPRITGAVSGTARLSGTWHAPEVRAHLTGRELAYADQVRVGGAALRGEFRAAEVASFRAELHATRVQAAGWTGERLDLSATGSETSHTLAVRAQGGELDLALQARGSWHRARGWSGVVEQARNSGPVAFEIAAPVEIALSPRRVLVGPLSARLMDGELEVTGFRYRDGVLDTEGRFARLPVRPIAALAGVALRPQDSLRLSGRWSVKQAERLAVAFDVRRDSGDLTVGTTQPLALGLQALRAEGGLLDGRLNMRAEVRSALLTGTAEGSIATTTAGGIERIGKDSPVRFAAQAQIGRLAALSGLLGSAAHLDGRVRADLRGGGTVGKPVVSGTVDGDRLVVALPPQGIELREGTLHATLQANQLEVREFAIKGGSGTLTATGKLAFAEGQRASLDWRAERLMVLARPDRRLVVTGSGNAALDHGKLTLTGRLHANEGLFQFGQTTLPALGPDVIVAGRKPAAEEPTLLSRASLDLTLDFGNDLRIVGHGLDAWIDGKVAVTTGPRGELLARGTLRTQRGTYAAYGQRLQIERGQLVFGGPVDNPGLDIVAMRKNQAVEAGVAVTGTVQAPLVRVVSDPPVPEGEALSWLVLGRGPADASRADLAMLPLAAAALFGPAKAGQGSFANKLGLDTLAVRGSGGGGGGGGGALANQVLAVGKRISHNLYVIYEQGLGAASNVLKIEYNLTRRFVLRAEAGQVSAAGLFYRYAFD